MPYKFEPALRARMATQLESFERRAIADPALRHAAVAVVIGQSEASDEACVLLTRRPKHLNRHAGQYALPGGRMDEGETATDAALRETHEELGLALAADAVLGVLDDYATRSGFCITPVVIWGGTALDLAPDPNEVAFVHRIPLSELDTPQIPHLEPSADAGRHVLSTPFASLGHRIYAPTAAILYQFREVALRGEATRVAHFDQPRFAWR